MIFFSNESRSLQDPAVIFAWPMERGLWMSRNCDGVMWILWICLMNICGVGCSLLGLVGVTVEIDIFFIIEPEEAILNYTIFLESKLY